MSYSRSSKYTRYPLEELFHSELLTPPRGLDVLIPRTGHPQVVGIAFEIMFNLELSRILDNDVESQEYLNLKFAEYKHYHHNLSEPYLEYHSSGRVSPNLIINIWHAAKNQQDFREFGKKGPEITPSSENLKELKSLFTWIRGLGLKADRVFFAYGKNMSEPDLIIQIDGNDILFEFKVVTDFGRFREHLTQSLLYFFDISTSKHCPKLNQLWIFYPRHHYIHKLKVMDYALRGTGGMRGIKKTLMDVYEKSRSHKGSFRM